MKHSFCRFQRVLTLILSLFLSISAFAPTAGAETALAAQPVFSDVRPESWYYGEVMKLYAAGIVDGYPDGKFRPDAQVTCAESMKMILSAAGGPILTARPAGQPWYQPYYDYARQRNVENLADLSPDAPISRSRAVKLIVRAMGIPLSAQDGAGPFADDADVYALTLNRVNILRGERSDGRLYFRGERALSRAELAALVARMLDYLAAQPRPVGDGKLQPASCTLPDAPTEVEDFVRMLICLSVGGVDEQIFVYRGVDAATVRDVYLPRLKEAYPIATDLCRESVIYYHYYNITLAYIDDYVTMTLQLRGRDYSAEECRAMFTYTVEEAEAVVERIRAEMAAAGETTQKDYARRCLAWLTEHCEYLDGNRLTDQYAYSVFADGTSVCSGYTAAYNLLLKLGDVRCMSMTGTAEVRGESAPHAWTIAELDGEICMIDATWCDRDVSADREAYFALDEETFSRDHTAEWDWRTYWPMLE